METVKVTNIEKDDFESRQEVEAKIASALRLFYNHIEDAVTSIAEVTAAEMLDKCQNQRQPGQDDVPISRNPIGFFWGCGGRR